MNMHETQFVATQSYGSDVPGQVKLKPGDVVRVLGCAHMVVRANDSCAMVNSGRKKQHTVTDKLRDTVKTFETPVGDQRISSHLDAELVIERQGEAGLKHFLATKTVLGARNNQQEQDTATEGTNSMAKKAAKTKKAAKAAEQTGERAATSKGKLGNIMGFSTCAVLRRLGMAKVSVKHATAIMEAQGIAAGKQTISINIGLGASGKAKSVADLTKAQVDELIGSAKEPKEEKEAKE